MSARTSPRRRRRRIDHDNLFYGTITATGLLVYGLIAARLIGGA